jgi:dihydroorotate dehydrogenase (NAD+) catalytic subunit
MSIPILNASGCLDALVAPDVAETLDAFVTKTVTPLPREGNPPPRIAETELGMLNSIGLQNPGIDAFLDEHLPKLAELAVPLWVSIGGFSASDYAELCARLDERDEIATVELNLSCPNVEEAPEASAELVAAAREQTKKPLYAKLSPATWNFAETARAVADAGADGLSLVNTIRGLSLDPQTLAPTLARGAGGYSGPALRPIALQCVYACSGAVDLPIVGMGGVTSGYDALALIAAGASAVALGTVLFAEPAAAPRIRRELAEAATARGYGSAADLRSNANESSSPAGVSTI